MSSEGQGPVRRLARQALLTASAVTLMYAVAQRATMHVFPGGGEFHAIFAYSGGRWPAALLAFRVHVGAVCVALAVLIALRYPLEWRLLALAASSVCCVYWWDVVMFPYQRDGFRFVLAALLAAIPPVCFAVGAIVHRAGAAWRRRVGGREAPAPVIRSIP